MLDKSIPFLDIIMHRKAGTPFVDCPLPEGYSFALFQAGDEVDWAKIEASTLEFDEETEALVYFQKDRLPYLKELERRCLFAVAPDGEKVATATAWWNYTGTRRDNWLHWVSAKPQHQNKGIGKAIVSRALRLIEEIEGEGDVYLHTQTWSHKAVGIYEKAGFFITPEKGLAGYPNRDYLEALTMIRGLQRIHGQSK